MPSTFTPVLNLEKPATGEQDSTWGTTLNSDWDKVDARAGGTYSTSMADADFSITQANAANANITATGAITANRNFIFPVNVGGRWEFTNSTTGGFTVTVKTAGGTGVVVRQNERMVVASDGTNCYDAGLGTMRRDGLVNWAIAGGTADALTAAYTPANTTLADGQLFFVRATAANVTTTPTLAVDGLTARTVTKRGGSAVGMGEWANLQELILRYNLANTRLELLDPTPGLFLLQTQTASNVASVDFVSQINSNFDEFLFIISNFVPATNGTALLIRISQDAGATWKSGAATYRWANFVTSDAATNSSVGSAGDTSMQAAAGFSNLASQIVGGEVRLFNPSTSGTLKPFLFSFGTIGSGTSFATQTGGGTYSADGNAISGVRFLMSSGNISTGTFSLYGLRK